MTPQITANDTAAVSLRARSRLCHHSRIGVRGTAKRGRMFADMTSTLGWSHLPIRRKAAIGYQTKVDLKSCLLGRGGPNRGENGPARRRRVDLSRRLGPVCAWDTGLPEHAAWRA